MKITLACTAGPLARTTDGAYCTKEGDELVLEAEADAPSVARLAGAVVPVAGVRLADGHLVTTWRIPIHTWAGRAELEITDGARVQELALDVAPHPGKLGLDAFREMLDELSAVSKDLPWGLSPGHAAAARDEASPCIIHPSILDAELPALLRALEQLRRDPLIATVRSRHLAPLSSARHVDARSMRWLVTHPRVLVARGSTESSESARRLMIDQRQAERTFAHPATQHIRFLLERLARTMSRSAARLAVFSRGQRLSPEDAEHARWLAQKLTRSKAAIDAELESAPFSRIEARAASEGAAQAIVDHPVYGRVQRLLRRLLDPGLHIEEAGALRASMRRTHELYELLVFFRAVAALKVRLNAGTGWKTLYGPLTSGGVLAGIADNTGFAAEREDGTSRIELRYQPTFGSYPANGKLGALQCSLSGERRPDIVLAVFQSGTIAWWGIVDAKYRASRSAIHDGLADMHVYLDSLHWHGRRADHGMIAVPACEAGARVYASREYRAVHRRGVAVTGEGGWVAALLDHALVAAGY